MNLQQEVSTEEVRDVEVTLKFRIRGVSITPKPTDDDMTPHEIDDLFDGEISLALVPDVAVINAMLADKGMPFEVITVDANI